MTLVIMLAVVANGDPDPNARQLKLLKTFRSEFVSITPGKGKFPRSFEMGRKGEASATPLREVTFAYSFAVAKYEVTQELWQSVMGDNPSLWKGPRNSVEMLSYDEAVDFCKKITGKLRAAKLIAENNVVRLPSEAEWEYVARAGTKSAYSFGDGVQKLNDYAWHTGNASGNDPPVGVKKPNPWGLFDIHGYLWEWCLDVAHDDYKGAPLDGSAWMKGGDEKRRVMRGGSWKDTAPHLSSFNRDGALRTRAGVLRFRGGVNKSLKDDAVGLRCVLAKGAE